MRVLLFSATELGMLSIEILNKISATIVGIVALPQEFQISYSATKVRNRRYCDFSKYAEENNIPLIIFHSRMSDIVEKVCSFQPDLILVAGWYHMIPKRIRSIASLGCIGLHASLLPKYRGGAPLVWAMIEGERETGVTLFHLEDGVDNGDIIGQERFEISENDTISKLIFKSSKASQKLLKKYLPLFAKGSVPRIKQDESIATHYPQRSPDDGCIDWSWSADKISRFIRAQTKPYPGAFTDIGKKRIRIWDADIEIVK